MLKICHQVDGTLLLVTENFQVQSIVILENIQSYSYNNSSYLIIILNKTKFTVFTLI